MSHQRNIVATILNPNHNWESADADGIFKKAFRIVFGLEQSTDDCPTTTEEIIVLLKEQANMELLISY